MNVILVFFENKTILKFNVFLIHDGENELPPCNEC
jgi:hypothetical protein